MLCKTHTYNISHELILNAQCRLTLEQLLVNGANINYQNEKGWCLLFEYVVLDLGKEIQYFSSKGLNFHVKDKKGRNALFWAVHKDNLHMVKQLISLASYLQPHKQESLPLFHYAVYKQNIHIIQSFLDNGVDINAQDKYGNTALAYAKEYKLKEITNFLLRKGAHTTNLEH